jgi:hypothetical protein
MTIERTISRKWTREGIVDLRRLIMQALNFDTETMAGIHLFVPNDHQSEIHVIFIADEGKESEWQRVQQWITKEQAEPADEGLLFEDLCKKSFKGEFSLFSNGDTVLETGLVLLEAALDKNILKKARNN